MALTASSPLILHQDQAATTTIGNQQGQSVQQSKSLHHPFIPLLIQMLELLKPPSDPREHTDPDSLTSFLLPRQNVSVYYDCIPSPPTTIKHTPPQIRERRKSGIRRSKAGFRN